MYKLYSFIWPPYMVVEDKYNKQKLHKRNN